MKINHESVLLHDSWSFVFFLNLASSKGADQSNDEDTWVNVHRTAAHTSGYALLPVMFLDFHLHPCAIVQSLPFQSALKRNLVPLRVSASVTQPKRRTAPDRQLRNFLSLCALTSPSVKKIKWLLSAPAPCSSAVSGGRKLIQDELKKK